MLNQNTIRQFLSLIIFLEVRKKTQKHRMTNINKEKLIMQPLILTYNIEKEEVDIIQDIGEDGAEDIDKDREDMEGDHNNHITEEEGSKINRN